MMKFLEKISKTFWRYIKLGYEETLVVFLFLSGLLSLVVLIFWSFLMIAWSLWWLLFLIPAWFILISFVIGWLES